MFILNIFGVKLPSKGENISTELKRWGTSEDKEFTYWERVFFYNGNQTVNLSSKFKPIPGGFYEKFKLGFSLFMRVDQIPEGIIFKSKKITFRIFGRDIPVPAFFTLGNLTVTQKAIDEKSYFLNFVFKHPILGVTYRFYGKYQLI